MSARSVPGPDAGDPDAVARSADLAVERLGALDVLVNNAGIGVEASLLRTPLADYDRLMDVNVRGYFLYTRAAYPYLARRRGCMIHIASDAGIWGEQSIGLYSVSKGAVVMLGKMLALEGGHDGSRTRWASRYALYLAGFTWNIVTPPVSVLLRPRAAKMYIHFSPQAFSTIRAPTPALRT